MKTSFQESRALKKNFLELQENTTKTFINETGHIARAFPQVLLQLLKVYVSGLDL
jgi:hypothetical protein